MCAQQTLPSRGKHKMLSRQFKVLSIICTQAPSGFLEEKKWFEGETLKLVEV